MIRCPIILAKNSYYVVIYVDLDILNILILLKLGLSGSDCFTHVTDCATSISGVEVV
jgi:hypothetical protein